MRDLAIIFARAPRLGTVKRRLAHDIGDRAALRFHRTMLNGLIRDLARDRRFDTVLVLTPDRGRFRSPIPIRTLPQGHGDLGVRMARALSRAHRAVLVGCDIPGVGTADIVTAFRALGRADAVFGPAEDGGYWLVGQGPRRASQPFARVRWSSEHALADTLRNFRWQRTALLRYRRDVDTIADLPMGRTY